MKCPGLHCPGCGNHGGAALASSGSAVAIAVTAYAAWEIITALIWIIVAVFAAAVVIGVPALVVTARRMNRPIYRPQPVYRSRPAAPIAAGPSRAELEDRLRAAEIDARAAVLAASILAQHARPLPLSGSYSDTEKVIRFD